MKNRYKDYREHIIKEWMRFDKKVVNRDRYIWRWIMKGMNRD
jgi:hypothetical protein